MLQRLKTVLVHRHIGILVVAILVARACITLLHRLWSPICYVLVNFYNNHCPSDSLKLNPANYTNFPILTLGTAGDIVIGVTAQISVAIILYAWLYRPSKVAESNRV